ncbi:hypothetical protein UFOVP781_29 [uncultured Caudovirales phage]|uniref:Uncharacterized protein n=1 Tax=uncultured Caudovirales phage TaxID=2100421 RepID=A0A6J5P467_9CAUD|nr:hypothetical protein UFOVP279_34 [uncultured Caudovirales phage]CAB4162284.1 hypothetical protein UFOVP781_29 [uncultured Caudovirales phage]
MSIQNYIAIDPGVGGGIAYIDTDGSTHALPMPGTLHDMDTQMMILCTQHNTFSADTPTVFLEELPKFAGKMSGSSMATMFRNYGRIEGLLAAYGARIEYLPPKKWQQALGLGEKKTHGNRWKAHLKGRAQALYPKLSVTLKTADALLILEAGRTLTNNK